MHASRRLRLEGGKPALDEIHECYGEVSAVNAVLCA